MMRRHYDVIISVWPRWPRRSESAPWGPMFEARFPPYATDFAWPPDHFVNLRYCIFIFRAQIPGTPKFLRGYTTGQDYSGFVRSCTVQLRSFQPMKNSTIEMKSNFLFFFTASDGRTRPLRMLCCCIILLFPKNA